MQDNSYDVLTCVAALSTGHIQSNMLSDMLRVVKKGGHMIFTVRDNLTAIDYVAQLKKDVQEMCDAGQWRQVSLSRATQYRSTTPTPRTAAGRCTRSSTTSLSCRRVCSLLSPFVNFNFTDVFQCHHHHRRRHRSI